MIWLLCFANIFLYVVRIGIDQWSTVYAFQELKLSKAVAIQGFTLFEAGALVGTLLWGWLSDLANGRRGLVACIALALIIATLGVYQHASNQYIYLASLFALGFLVFGPQLLIGVAAVGFVPKKAIGAADGIKGTFAYLIGDSFAKLGLGMIADGTPVFGLTGWAGHLRRAGYRRDWLYLPDGDSGGDGRTQNPPREKNSAVDSGINVTGDFCPA
ncbi:hypothetical protein EIMP300_10480 [Escherichia coli]|uniref:Hexosephosphate transport protein n=1 Tax=Escherichia coli TaxID=562 RepID=A0A8S0FHP3_ECOLX|nr:hypothetical protein EIMP300_10480 [Escherichia coli]